MVITLSIASILSAAADNLKYAPHNFSVLPPSPEVESLNRYIDFGVSLASGQPDINLPIYEVCHGSLSVPISIGYHGGGIKVNEKAGIVGLGWTLLAGATISRTVNGLPDEMLAEGGMMRGLFNITSDGKNSETTYATSLRNMTMLWQTPTMSNTFLAIASHTRKTVLTLPTMCCRLREWG